MLTNEKKIVRRLLSDLTREHLVTVNDGEEDVIEKSSDIEAIYAGMYATDQDFLIVFNKAGDRLGFVHLIYGNGNSGNDVISDYSLAIEHLVSGANAIAEALDAGEVDEPPTNVSFVMELMTYSRYGALSQMFVMDAIGKFAEAVAASSDEAIAEAQEKSPLVDMRAWRDVAIEIRDKLNKHYQR